MRKISTYTITITPSKSVENDKRIYGDFEKALENTLRDYFFDEEVCLTLSVDFE